MVYMKKSEDSFVQAALLLSLCKAVGETWMASLGHQSGSKHLY